MSILKKLRRAVFGSSKKTTTSTMELTPEQQALWGQLMYGNPNLPSLGESADLFRGSYGFDPAQFQQFMNPYLTGVLGDLETRGVRTLMEDVLPGIQDRFVVAGQPGSSRHEEFTNRAVRDTMDMILSNQYQAGLGSHNAAMQSYQQSQDLRGRAGAGIGSLVQQATPQPWTHTNVQPGATPFSQLSGAGMSLYGLHRMFG